MQLNTRGYQCVCLHVHLQLQARFIQTKFSVLAFYRRVNKLPKSIQSRLLQYIIKQKYFSIAYMAIYLTVE